MSSAPKPPTQTAKSRLLITLVLDTSKSMAHNDAIGQLNGSLTQMRDTLLTDPEVRRIGEIAIVTFGPEVTIVNPRGGVPQPDDPYTPVSQFTPPVLSAGGFSPMVEAVERAIEIIDRRRDSLRSNGIAMAFRPLLYLVSDGVPTDPIGQPTTRWRDLSRTLRRRERDKNLLFTAIGVRGADTEIMLSMAADSYYPLGEVDFRHVIRLVSTSIPRVLTTDSSASAAYIHRQVRDGHVRSGRMWDWLNNAEDPPA